MSVSVLPALSGFLNGAFDLHKSRILTLGVLIVGMIQSRTCNLEKLACHFPGPALVASNSRRLRRFFCAISLDQRVVATVILRTLAPKGALSLSLDRTNWKLGRRDVNILVLALTTRRYSIPLLWRVLDHAGNSNTALRQELVEDFLQLCEAKRIKILLADREFIGHQWLDFLCKNKVPFLIRLKEDLRFHQANGHELRFKNMVHHASRVYDWSGHLTGLNAQIRVVAKTCKSGELLILATNMTSAPKTIFATYKKRWRIECLFANTKTRGFNLEDTHLTCQKKIASLLAVVTLACLWVYLSARSVLGNTNPKRKSHGRKEKSIFSIGLEKLRQGLINSPENACKLFPQAKMKE